MHDKVAATLCHTQSDQKQHANKCRHNIDYAIGDKELLSTRNLRLQSPRKLHDRFVRPFKVTERIGQTAYHLDLTGRRHRLALRSIHDVLHVSLLKPCKDNGMAANAPPVAINEHEEYEIEKILQHR